MKFHGVGIVCTSDLFRICKYFSFAFCPGYPSGHVIDAEDNILTGHNDRTTIGRRKDVVARQHQCPGLNLSFYGKGYVNRHLVTVEVSIKRRTDQWMELDGLSLDENRFECLNTQSVKGGRTV